MSFYDAIRIGSSGDAGFKVERSLRFNHDDDPYLSFTPSSTGNRKVWTFSAWIKRTEVNDRHSYIYTANNSNSAYFALYFRYDQLYSYFDPGNNYGAVSDREFRDLTGWFHLVHQVDAENTTQKIWINGVEMTLNSSRNPGNNNYPINTSGLPIVIGKHSWGTTKFSSMYLAEVHHSDGYKYTPTDYAETNAETGQWIPKLPSIQYGTNGFYLKFADNSGTSATTLGKDYSGNTNNFTPNNFATSDAVKDTPTNNFCTLNPLSSSTKTQSEGMLETKANSTSWRTDSTTFHVSSGKWYWELLVTAVGTYQMHGIVPARRGNGKMNFDGDIYPGSYSNEWGYRDNGILYNSASGTTGWGAAYTTGDILSFALDMDNGTLDIKKNDSATGSQITGISGEYRPAFTNWAATSITNVNFGQDSSFAGEKTTQGNTDDNGKGDFYYAPPSGYLALCSANLPDPTINFGNKHFEALTYNGNFSTNAITGLQFQPDWLWFKNRELTNGHALYDSVRGRTLALNSNTTSAEIGPPASDDALTSIDSNGFTMGANASSPSPDINYNYSKYVAWCWNAGNSDSATYRVVVVSDSGNKYRFRNSANTTTFGQSAVTLDLVEGGTYIFNMDDSTNASHPFSIGTAANSNVYTSGITYFLDGVSKTYSEYTSGFASATTRRLHITVPASAPVLYYWCSVHGGMGGQINTNTLKGSSNFDGSVQSTVKANTTGGFSIVNYAGNQSSAYTVGHGLGVAPKIIFAKSRTNAVNWGVYFNIFENTNYMSLNTNGAIGANNSGEMSGKYAILNADTVQISSAAFADTGSSIIMYAFSQVEGYSKIESYYGNASTDGPYVHLGFKPAFLLIKRSAAAGNNWTIIDNKRDNEVSSSDNPISDQLWASLINAEGHYTSTGVDFLANGFKIRMSDNWVNAASQYIYFAIAESPFKNNRAR